MSRILVAEDESRIASFVEKGLRANGFTPTVVGDGATFTLVLPARAYTVDPYDNDSPDDETEVR